MIQIQKIQKENNKGFTLIELMTVIAIIGILAMIAIPNYIAHRDKAFCGAAENDARNIIGVLADYFSVPAHNSFIPVVLTANTAGNQNASPVNGITYNLLSGHNTASINGVSIATLTIEVTDGSARCPNKYQTADPQWFNGVYRKTF
jgi:prepilin-type N-terminal cleavage/methylation domain-containing protein